MKLCIIFMSNFLKYLFNEIVVREVLNKLLGITYPYNFLVIPIITSSHEIVPTKFTSKIILKTSPRKFLT
jgi:hypothetical protein